MNDNFNILIPEIFPKDRIISGVTKRNLSLFPDKGFTISNQDVFTENEIEQHRRFLAGKLGVEFEQMKFQKQVHKTDIQIATSNTPNGLESDGMITSEHGIILNVSIADCLAILMFDPINRVIAAVHSGWKGTKESITDKCINILIKKFNSKPNELIVYLSPCASGRNYEVGYDVAKYFPETTQQISKSKYLFDNQKEVLNQLIRAGVKESNVESSSICTIENNEYHSFRRDRDKSGRMSAFIGIL